MRPPARGAARLLSGAGLAAALLLPAAVPAAAAGGSKGQELPPMPAALAPDAACTPAS
ncbi:hypothetical protein SZN_31574, partial [Streptomyces zinciresistens K42]